MKKPNYICIFGFVFSLLFSVAGCKDGILKKIEDEKIIYEEYRADYVIKDVIHYSYEHGILKLKIEFEHGEYYSDKDQLFVENCSFVYYDNSGEAVSKGSSKRARFFEGDSLLVADEDVEVVSEINRGKLNTEYLEWHGVDNKFITPSFVTFTRENGDILSGKGMIADVGLRVITINKDVRGVLADLRE